MGAARRLHSETTEIEPTSADLEHVLLEFEEIQYLLDNKGSFASFHTPIPPSNAYFEKGE